MLDFKDHGNVTPKKISHGSQRELNVKFHKNCDYTGKISENFMCKM